MILHVHALPPSPNVLRRKYRHPQAYKRLREEWELMTLAAARPEEREHWRRIVKGDVRVRLCARIYHKRLYDPDNLPASLKPVIDALVNVRFLRDDSAKYFHLEEVSQTISGEVSTMLYLAVEEKQHAA